MFSELSRIVVTVHIHIEVSFLFSFRMNPFVHRKRRVNNRLLRNRLQRMVDNVLRSAVSVTGERLNSESHCNANEETGFVADDEADDCSDEAEEVGVTHDIRLFSSPEDIRMENVSFTETVASECEEYYMDSSYFSPIETTIIEDKYGSVFIVGHSYHNESAFFVHPCNSDEVLSIKSVSLPSAFSSKWPIQIIKTKAIVIPTIPDDDADDDTEESYAVFPLHMKNKHD